MFKEFPKQVCAFDCEWVPDARAGQLFSDAKPYREEKAVFEAMWKRHRDYSAENPRPFLKLIQSRVVSIAALVRKQTGNGAVQLTLASLPKSFDSPPVEKEIIGRFLDWIGTERPQLIGFNSQGSDLPILVQRGIVNGVRAAGFCFKPNKPWEGYDYFNRYSEGHLDLMSLVSGFGSRAPSLNEVAVLSGIPGKLDVSGSDVADLWLAGKYRKIVEYNEHDALTTYLLWMRMSLFAGHLTQESYEREEDRLHRFLEQRGSKHPHLLAFLEKWDALRAQTQRGEDGQSFEIGVAPH
jgi:predicted PolB exonuclease-like 3'-5' exonuclease